MTQPAHLPTGYHTVTLSLAVRNAPEALEFYERAFGAERRRKFTAPGGQIMYGELRIGDSILVLTEEGPVSGMYSPQHYGGATSRVILYLPDVEAAFARAIEAGAKPVTPPTEPHGGVRHAVVMCPYNHLWVLSTQVEELPEATIQEHFDALFKRLLGGK